MPDNMLVPYPQPPPPNSGLATGDPSRLLGMIPAFSELRSRQAYGNALQQSVDPSGNFDTGGFLAQVSRDPVARLQMDQAVQLAQQQRARQFELATAQRAAVANLIGAYSSRNDASPEGAIDLITRMSRIPGMDPRVLQTIKDSLIGLPPDQFRSRLADIELSLRGAEARSATGAGPVDQSGGMAGAAPMVSAAQATRETIAPGTGIPSAAGAPAAPGPRYMTLPTGQSDIYQQSAQRASALQATASSTAQYHADLDNLKQESSILGNLGGPSIEVEKKLNQLSQRLAGFGVTMTPDQLRAVESFDKIANQLSLAQGQRMAGTDAGRSMSVGANPSSGQSRYGRDGVIDMLQGNQDAIDKTRQLWITAQTKGVPWFNDGKPISPPMHDAFINELVRHDPEHGKIGLDPRVFQFNRLSYENQQKFWSQMDADDALEFKQKYLDAAARGWVKPPKKKPANAAQ